jgi:hypothetical protein
MEVRSNGMSRSAVTQGITETAHPKDAASPDRARMAGGGRKKISEKYPCYEKELENLLASSVTGDLEKPLRHVSKSTEPFTGVGSAGYSGKL